MKLSDLKKEVGVGRSLLDLKKEINNENAYKKRDEAKRNEINTKEEENKKQSLPMKALEFGNALSAKALKSLSQLGDMGADTVRQNIVSDEKRFKDTANMINKKLGTNIQTSKSSQDLIDKYENVKPISSITEFFNKQEQDSTARLKAGNSNVENVITDIALAGGDMAIKAIPSIATGLPLLPFTIGATSYADTFQNDMLKGIDRNKAGVHALGSGVISGGIESLTGIGASGVSKALASTAGKKLLSKFPTKVAEYLSKASNSTLGGIFKNALGEGLEEGIEYDVQRVYQNLVLDENTPRDVKEQAYSMMLGAGVGGLFGGGKALMNKTPSLPNMKKETPSLPNMKKPISLNEAEQSIEPKNVPNNVDIDNGNVLSQEEIKEPLKSNLGVNNDIVENKRLINRKNDVINTLKSEFDTKNKSINEEFKNLETKFKENGVIDTFAINNIKDIIRNTEVKDTAYNEYESVRKDIRKTKFKITDELKNMGNYNEFRKNNLGNIKLSKEGIEVYKWYQEMSNKYPNLFPTDIINQQDQLIQISEVANGTKQNVSTYGQVYGEKVIDEYVNESVMNFIDRISAINEDIQSKENVKNTPIEELYKQRKVLQETYDNAVSKGSLTDTERHYLDGLIKGVITIDQLPNNVRKANIQAMYDVKKPLEDIKKQIDNNKKEIKGSYRELASNLIQNSETWKDKKTGLQYQRETMERNFRDIIPDKAEAEKVVDTYFTPIHNNEAKSTTMKNDYRDKIKALNLSDKAKYKVTYRQTEQGLPIFDKVSESALVQLLGEKKIDETMVKGSGADLGKIKNAVETFRTTYNELIEKANQALIRNGYAPVEYRQDYFPHFQDSANNNLFGNIAKKLGFDVNIMNIQELPTDIAGLTHTFRPGKKWVGNFLRRTSNETDYDALKGFDRYIEGVSDVIHHTDDIQRLRALETELRYKYSSDGIKAEVDKIRNDENIAPEDKQARINELFDIDKTKFPHLVTQLRSYTDNLAGKKDINDRNMEHNLGRGMYEIAKAMENRVASNMVALNPGSWITNFIPLTQALGGVKTTNLLNGMKDTIAGIAKSDGLIDKSSFLTNRRGSEPLVKTGVQKVSGALVSPMQWIDNFTSESLVRARYYENMRNGMSEAEAIQDADKWTASLMADRSKGALPTIFNQKNPVTKLFTMFQVEVNNQLGFYFKDVPREYKDKAVTELAGAFLKMFVGAFLYNELYEKITGRRSAFDPIDIIKSAYEDFADEDKKKGQAVIDTTVNVGQNLPFIGTLIDGGRVPMSSMLPNLTNLVNATTGLATGEMNSKKALNVLGKEVAKPLTYLVPPVGGGQLKKIGETIDVMRKGGSYGVDSEGRDTLQFTAEPTLPNMLKSATFGKYSLPDAKRYVDSGFKSLGGKVTEQYKKARDYGFTHEEFMTAYKALNSAESDKDKDGKTIRYSLGKNQIKAIREVLSSVNSQKLEYLYELFEINDGTKK